MTLLSRQLDMYTLAIVFDLFTNRDNLVPLTCSSYVKSEAVSDTEKIEAIVKDSDS